MANLPELFGEYFEVLTGDSLYIREESFKLRYQVYCLEKGFEDATAFPSEQETDQYDKRSVHGIVRHKETGVTAATVRLVLPDKDDPGTAFPVEKNCQTSIHACREILRSIPRGSLAEISRFAVSKDFKRRVGEAGTVAGIGPNPDSYFEQDPSGKRVIPHLTIGLFAAIVKNSARNNIKYWYAVMDVSLLRLLGRFGITFLPLGGIVDYHGLRQPCIGKIDNVLAGILRKQPEVWGLITENGAIWPAPDSKKRDDSWFSEAGVRCHGAIVLDSFSVKPARQAKSEPS
jgi:N-acyl amino acid synthase of PEP-CTERM/exosortase system